MFLYTLAFAAELFLWCGLHDCMGEAGDTEAASSALEDCKHIRSSVQISAPIALEVKAFLCIYSVSVLNLQGLRKD